MIDQYFGDETSKLRELLGRLEVVCDPNHQLEHLEVDRLVRAIRSERERVNGLNIPKSTEEIVRFARAICVERKQTYLQQREEDGTPDDAGTEADRMRLEYLDKYASDAEILHAFEILMQFGGIKREAASTASPQ